MDPVAPFRPSPAARLRSLAAAGFALAALAAPAAPQAAPSGAPAPASQAAAPAPFRVVGYMPTYQGDVAAIQYSKLTHVMLSFARPNDDGSLADVPAAKLARMVPLAHAAGTKVFLALGGGGNGDKGWIAATGSDAARRALVAACMKAVREHKLDGIDFDWEYPDGAAQVAGFNAAVKLLAAELHAEGKEISAAVTYNDWPRSFPTGELFQHFDFLNIMVYDNPAPHATMAHARTALDVWVTQKRLPKEKFVLGCPFYSSAGRKYSQIVAADPAAAWVDRDGAEASNSIPTIRKKTRLALERGGGVMFWELSQDATGELSLLSAVHEVVKAAPVSLSPGLSRAAARGSALAFRQGRLLFLPEGAAGPAGNLAATPGARPFSAVPLRDAAGRASAWQRALTLKVDPGHSLKP